MNSKTKVLKKPPFRAGECAIILMTTLVLAGVFGLLCTDLFSFRSALPAGARGISPSARHEPSRDEQGTGSGAKVSTEPAHGKKAAGAHLLAEAAKKSSGAIGGENRPTGDAHLPQLPTLAEAQEPPARVAGAAPPPPGLVLGASFIGQTILVFASLCALATIAALVFVYGFFALLRRRSRDFGALIHIEYAGAQPMVIGPFTASSLGVAAPVAAPTALAGNDRGSPMSATDVAAHTAKASDFGGSFGAERQMMDAKAQRQDAAVLQQLFEDNLELQARISLAQGKQQALTLDEAAAQGT